MLIGGAAGKICCLNLYQAHRSRDLPNIDGQTEDYGSIPVGSR